VSTRISGAVLALAILLDPGFGSAVAQPLPAVSAINGKAEFDAGVLSLPSFAFVGRAAGTVTIPVGDRFGIQADASVVAGAGPTGSAAFHAFTRDPQSYLIGGTLGMVRTPGSLVVAAGPEAELYFDRWTIEAWAGASVAVPSGGGPTRYAPMAMASLGYYLTDNARVTFGVSTLDGYAAVQGGGEYLLESFDLPLAVTAERRVGQDGAWRVTLGGRGYFSPEVKSLIRRHREDDSSDRGAALYTAAGGKTLGGGRSTAPGASGPPPPTPVCLDTEIRDGVVYCMDPTP
jgi:hypothetical protein